LGFPSAQRTCYHPRLFAAGLNPASQLARQLLFSEDNLKKIFFEKFDFFRRQSYWEISVDTATQQNSPT
jgi:hypothetical protein